MKQRLITAAIAIALLVVIMFSFDTIVYPIALTIVSILAVYELLAATKCTQNKALMACSLVFAATVPFLPVYGLGQYIPLGVTVFVFVLFGILLREYRTIRFEQVGLVFFISLFFPFAAASLVYIREEFGLVQGQMYIWLVFACACGSDAGAYFIGRCFGKKKLAPEISPNKTVEGFFGGFLGAFLAMLFILLCFSVSSGGSLQVRWWPFVLFGVFGTLMGVFGDLSASLIKRQFGIKDFGNILPGHGGIMDRFDSIFFVAPLFYMLLHYLPV